MIVHTTLILLLLVVVIINIILKPSLKIMHLICIYSFISQLKHWNLQTLSSAELKQSH